MKKLTELASWQALTDHYKTIAPQHMQDWFNNERQRFANFSLIHDGLLVDYSKNRVTRETLRLLGQLAEEAGLAEQISGLFNGAKLNTSEQRAALHTALRDVSNHSLWVDGINIMPPIHAALLKMQRFTEALHQQQLVGVTGHPFTDIVNIGIGGSHLGPLSMTHALQAYAKPGLRCHFIATIDKTQLDQVLAELNPVTTLFIISSKSFTTLETLNNAKTIRAWWQRKTGVMDFSKHFLAVTSAPLKAREFGIAAENIFPLWDFIGGRFSVWSAIGLPLACMIGMPHFYEFLKGAHSIDQHFKTQDFSQNIPVILALLGIWYINFFGANQYAIIPYAHELIYLRHHLQQVDMESNGKSISRTGEALTYATGPVVFGEHGSLGQHAFHQLLHQGPGFTPVDFILVGKNSEAETATQDILLGSGLSQSLALLRGKSLDEAYRELHAEGFDPAEARRLAPHRFIPGNRPSNIILLDAITPHNLGALLAVYEHKVMVQGSIWQINSFDQWGVELGKALLPQILTAMHNPAASLDPQLDRATASIIEYCQHLYAPVNNALTTLPEVENV